MAQDINMLNDSEFLSLPCEEPIDFRDLFPFSCSPYQQGVITHYLDVPAKKYYMEQIKQQGIYNQAVYKAVLKHATSRPDTVTNLANENVKQAKIFNPPAVIPVGYSQHRQEYRLNFATDIEIELPSGKIINGRSVDISPSGIQVKLQRLLDVIDGMELAVGFPNLEIEYEQYFGLVPYTLMKSSIGSMYMSLKLSRIDPGEHPFDIFLQDFIDNKKHRYRIDAEESKLALTAKAWEYLYIKSLPYIACFISTRGERLQIQEIAISENNKQQISGLGNSMLSLLEQQMSSFRLSGIAHRESTPPEIYAYRYQGTGLKRRLCATSWQFDDQKNKLTFLRAGINEETFTAWSINIIKLNDMSEQRSTELFEKLAENNAAQAENLMEQLTQYEYLIYLVDITENLRHDPLLKYAVKKAEHTDDPFEIPEDHFFDNYEIQSRHSAEFTRLRLGISKQRNEERYIYNSPIIMKFYGESIKGHTLDLSVNGLKIGIEKRKIFQIRDTVSIDFVGFNKKFKTVKLKNQSYRVAAMTRDGYLCLTRDHRVSPHEAAIFINKLLKKNKDILPTCTGELWMSTKSRLMEFWLNLCLPTQSLLISREQGNYDIPYVLSGNYTKQLLAPFKIGRDIYNFERFLKLPILKEKIRKLGLITEKPTSIEIYICQYGKSDDVPEIEVYTWSDFTEDMERAEYLKKRCHLPIFGCYNLSLSRVPRLEKLDLIDDMNIIRRNARHRLTEFETVYQSLVAVLELSDCTSLVLQRYNLSRK